MPKVDLKKHTLNLREGDYARINDVFAKDGISASFVIRRIISRYVDGLDRPPTIEEIEQIQGEI
jgi:hypothetical protein